MKFLLSFARKSVCSRNGRCKWKYTAQSVNKKSFENQLISDKFQCFKSTDRNKEKIVALYYVTFLLFQLERLQRNSNIYHDPANCLLN